MPVVSVRGLKELRHALEAMSKQAPKELLAANKRAGLVVVAEAVRLAPRGKHEGGGSVTPIARSIKVAVSPSKASITAGGKASPHAAGAEFGGYIPRRGFKGQKAQAKKVSLFYGGHAVTHVKQQPYLLPALQNKVNEVVKSYVQMLDALIAKFRSG